jgi:excisionase family DNA binding protein
LEIVPTKNLPATEFYSVTAAATILGVNGITLRRAIDRGELRRYRIGRKVLIHKADFRAWLERFNVSSAA